MSEALAGRAALLAWYDGKARVLPWRRAPGSNDPVDPYRIWLSEVMLQQTTAAAVGPYFERFTQSFPSVEALAAAPIEEIMRLWAGLGYYSRARNLHAAAARVAERGGFPQTAAELAQLPGVGAYTSAAIAAIAFGEAIVPVDGNVERVMARLFGVQTPLPRAKRELARAAQTFAGAERPGDLAQALMDLGATLCTPRKPRCPVCPLAPMCSAQRSGAPESLPRRAPRTAKPARRGAAVAILDGTKLLLVRRAPQGLLGGMAALPSTDWTEAGPERAEIERLAGGVELEERLGAVRHVFTHFSLTLDVWRGVPRKPLSAGVEWREADAMDTAGLPTVFAKAARLAISSLF